MLHNIIYFFANVQFLVTIILNYQLKNKNFDFFFKK